MRGKLITIVLILALLPVIGSADTIAGVVVNQHVSDSEGLNNAHADAIVKSAHRDAFAYTGAEAEDNHAYAFSADIGGNEMHLDSAASVTDTGKVVAFGQSFAKGETSSAGLVSIAGSGENGDTAGIDASASATGDHVVGFTWAVAYG